MPMDNLFDLADAVIYLLPLLAMAGFLTFVSTRVLRHAH